jgi:hypothetical protein
VLVHASGTHRSRDSPCSTETEEEAPMVRTLTRALRFGAAVFVLVPTLALASSNATVTKVEGKGVVTVKTEDGKEHQVQIRGVQEGDQVTCDVAKDGKLECEKKSRGGAD